MPARTPTWPPRIGIAAQSAYHALLTWSLTSSAWRTVLAALVGSLPPAFAGLAVHMRALIRRESDPTTPPPRTPSTVTIDRQPTTSSRLTRIQYRPPSTHLHRPGPFRARCRWPTGSPAHRRLTATRRLPSPVGLPATDRARPTVRTTSPAALVAPSTDTPVTAQAATQIGTSDRHPDLYARATQVATQYRTEHGTPITSGQLAVRLKVTSEQAAALLARIDQAQHRSHPSARQRPPHWGAPVTVSTLTVVPEATGFGHGPIRRAIRTHPRPAGPLDDLRDQAIARAARADFPDWLRHVRSAAGCTRPIRLSGTMHTVEAATGRVLSTVDTADLPDGVIYKPCGNRRETVCPTCSARYKRDAYHVVRAGLRRRQRRPRARRHPPGDLPDLHRTVVRRRSTPATSAGTPAATGANAPAGRSHATPAATPSPCPHGQPTGLLRPPRRDRPDPRLGAVPGLLRPRRARSCGTCTPANCGGAPPSP